MNGKILEPNSNNLSENQIEMTDTIPADVASVSEVSVVSSQIAGMKESYERKFNTLQSEIGQLNDLMLVMMEKSDRETGDINEQGPSKQPTYRLDKSRALKYQN